MIRTYRNETGSPEVRVRRESPVIGGAKIYPGTTISFTEAEWNVVPITIKNYLNVMVAIGSFSLTEDVPIEIKPFKEQPKSARLAMVEKVVEKEVVEEKVDEEVTDEAKSDEVKSDENKSDDVKSDETTDENKSDDVKSNEVVEGIKPVDSIEDIKESINENKPDEVTENADKVETTENENVEVADGKNENIENEEVKEEKPEVDLFNYVGFLEPSISKIKIAFKAMPLEERPSIEKLIEAEKADSNRIGLIDWLNESLS